MAIGIIAQATAQWFLARRGSSQWTTMAVLFAMLIPLTLLTGVIPLYATTADIALGCVAGVVLYAVTQLFLRTVRHWHAFVADVDNLYSQRGDLPLGLGIVVGALVAGGEELFWRGLVIAVLTPTLGSTTAALISLMLFIGVDAASSSRPVIIGAAVGGLAWTWLAVWSGGGLVAAIACHMIWTVMMISFPHAQPTAPRLGSET